MIFSVDSASVDNDVVVFVDDDGGGGGDFFSFIFNICLFDLLTLARARGQGIQYYVQTNYYINLISLYFVILSTLVGDWLHMRHEYILSFHSFSFLLFLFVSACELKRKHTKRPLCAFFYIAQRRPTSWIVCDQLVRIAIAKQSVSYVDSITRVSRIVISIFIRSIADEHASTVKSNSRYNVQATQTAVGSLRLASWFSYCWRPLIHSTYCGTITHEFWDANE